MFCILLLVICKLQQIGYLGWGKRASLYAIVYLWSCGFSLTSCPLLLRLDAWDWLCYFVALPRLSIKLFRLFYHTCSSCLYKILPILSINKLSIWFIIGDMCKLPDLAFSFRVHVCVTPCLYISNMMNYVWNFSKTKKLQKYLHFDNFKHFITQALTV